MDKAFLFFLFVSFFATSKAQFAGPVGSPSTTAIGKDSAVFVGWASSSKITRGLQDFTNPSLGYATFGDSLSATGKAGENGIVSLGDGGEVVLSFASPIFDGAGADFAIFENSFSDQFLELAFVEVSSDGQRFVRFPAICNLPTDSQFGAFSLLGDASKINNLAGKYRGGYGVPFDLHELSDSIGINLQRITHIKLIDAVGAMDTAYATYDSRGQKINDPWPTPFESSGFDLDAVGVIHQLPLSIAENHSESIGIYPNPFNTILNIETLDSKIILVSITDSHGAFVFESNDSTVDLQHLASGIYFVKVLQEDKRVFVKRIVKL
jgi:hypothetical protein